MTRGRRLSCLTRLISHQQGEECISGQRSLQVTLSSETRGVASSSPHSPPPPSPPQHTAGPHAESVTQPMAPSLVEKTNDQEPMEEPKKSQDMEQLRVGTINASSSGGHRTPQVGEEVVERAEGNSWEQRPRRPSQVSDLSSGSSDERLNYSSASPRALWERRGKAKPVAGAPDLVMDLPVAPLSSSPKEQGGVSPRLRRTHLRRETKSYDSSSSSGGSSPGTQSPDMTAGEVFAKQSQCTLKKTPALKSFGGYSTDAQTQTVIPVKVTSSLGPTRRNADATELRITEAEESSVSSIVRSLDDVMQRLDSEMRSERAEVSSDVSVEIGSASDKPQEVTAAPSTPKLTARYLQAVAASTGGSTPALKPPVRVKPCVLKKPSLTRGSPEPEPPK